jgi:hypothetical protein
MVFGVLLACLAAVGFGSGTFLQHITAVSVEQPKTGRRAHLGLADLLWKLIRSRRWLFGQVLASGGTAVQFAALAFAPVAVVEPIVGAGLPVALVLETIRERRWPGPRLVAGLVLCVGGLVTFLLASRASGPRTETHILSAAILLALAVGLALIARLMPGGRVGSALSGVTSGGCLGVAVVAVAIAIARLKGHGVLATFTHWSPYLAAACGLLATAATQQAFARGRLAWSLPALTVADPLVATVLSVLVLHEALVSGAAVWWVSGAVVAIVGVALSAASRAGRSVTGPDAASRVSPSSASHSESALPSSGA